MAQLTLDYIYNVAKKLINKGEDLKQYPIYIGDDDELNGIHNGCYIDILDVNDFNCEDFIELIKENTHATNLNVKGVLIS